jgi:hypothetical protein
VLTSPDVLHACVVQGESAGGGKRARRYVVVAPVDAASKAGVPVAVQVVTGQPGGPARARGLRA